MKDIVIILGGQVALLACLSWLIRFLFQTQADKDLERMKADLNHSNQKRLEEIKAILAYKIEEERTKFGWLHGKRIEAVEELLKMLYDFEFEAKALAMNLGVGYMDGQKERAFKLAEKYCEINALLHRKELYLGSVFVNTARGLFEPYFEYALNLTEPKTDHKLTRDEVNKIIGAIDTTRNEAIRLFETTLHPTQDKMEDGLNVM
jgi:hypothetical protein